MRLHTHNYTNLKTQIIVLKKNAFYLRKSYNTQNNLNY